MFGGAGHIWRVVVFVLMVFAVAQTGAAPPQGATPRARRLAVIVGIDEYQGFPTLRYCRADARMLAESLERACGYQRENIVLLVDDGPFKHSPTRQNVLDRLRSFAELAEPDDMLLFYFAGHGVLLGDRGFLVPVDARAQHADELLSIADLRAILRNSRARHRVMLIDACHSGAERGLARAMPPGLQEALQTDAEGIVTLASCRANEVSLESTREGHGLFTYWLAEGLRGKADAECAGNRDGRIEITELYHYVNQRVSAAAASQHGQQQTPSLLATVSGQIVIAVIVIAPAPAAAPPAVAAPAPAAPPRPAAHVARNGNVLTITTCGAGADDLAKAADARRQAYEAYAQYVRSHIDAQRAAEPLRQFARDRKKEVDAAERDGCLEMVFEIPLP